MKSSNTEVWTHLAREQQNLEVFLQLNRFSQDSLY